MCQNKTAMSFLLGIDGGGSKSAVAVSDGISVLATHTAGACNLTFVSRENARVALAEAVHGALSSAGISASAVSSVCAGVAGGSSPEVAETISAILAELLPHAAVQVVGDTVIALEAAFPGSPGVVCISGTGSVAFGRNERGEFARAGGWGRAVSDEGSGYWIGQRAVSQCLRAMDMGRSSGLITGIMEKWRIVTREQLVQRCHQDFPGFAELFPVVLAAAEANDLLASEILTVAGTELARVAQIVLRRLWAGRIGLEVAITGGVFARSSRIRQVFSNIIRTDRPEVHVRLIARQPYEGALYLAQQALPQQTLPADASCVAS
jgi:N-acetylglucosamine kinase-like BadF-type ATPase